MDIVQVMLIAGAVAGLVMMCVSFAGRGAKPGQSAGAAQGDGFITERLETMGTTISEADNVITELGGMSQSVMKELDQKYNELLYLYNLIDEKKRAADDGVTPAAPFSASPFATPAAPFSAPAAPFATSAAPFATPAAPFATSAAPFATSAAPFSAPEREWNGYETAGPESANTVVNVRPSHAVPSNPRLSRILELKAMGMSTAQIAKELDMGQGEVSLIMSLTGK